MKKRKIVSALLAMLLTFSAVSCSTTDEPSSDSSLDSTLSMEGSESSEDTPFTMPKYIPTWTSVNQHNTGGPADITENYWLTDDSLSPWTWCYTEGTRYYTPQHIIHTLADRISKNGNLLLNILPKADGSIPQNQKDILLAVGDWLKKNGEGVYATRAWEVFGEGPTQLGGGDFQEMKTGTAQDIRFTRTKDNTTLYAIVLGWPGDGAVLNIQTLAEGRIDLSSLTSVQLIGAAAGEYIDLSYTQTAEGLAVTMPDTMPCEEDAYMLKLSFSGEIPPLTPVSTPAE